ncbi:MAG: hypothetical protein PWP23_2136 [Candidatus Sumerlaeota bacterium]|nr:hypothetical protein [Candidatus Sumerlaeota bacterium]
MIRRGMTNRALLWAALVVALAARATAATPYVEALAEQHREERHAVLIAHGVNISSEAVLDFVVNGFTEATLSRSLPEQPKIKTEVINYAIHELGFMEAKEAVPVLTALVDGETTKGVRSILQYDAEPFAISEEVDYRAGLMAYVRYNSIVALGLIGDPAAAQSVRTAMLREEEIDFKSEAAVALGLMGDNRGLDYIINQAGDPTTDDQIGYFNAVYLLTGRNYGLTRNTSLAKRRKLYSDLQAWQASEGKNFAPNRVEILRRRVRGAATEDLPISSLRGALRATRSFGDYDLRYTARQRLRTLAPGAKDELRALSLDAFEDLDIRVAAMDWYAATDPKEAKSVMKDLRDDENEAVRRRAEMLVEDIDKALTKRK